MLPGVTALVGGALIVVGAMLPWLTLFAGLQSYPGVSGPFGRILLAGGVVAAAGGAAMLRHRDDRGVRIITGALGVVLTLFSGWLLLGLRSTTHDLAADPMLIARPGPGLFVTLAGAIIVAAVLLPLARRRIAARPVASMAALALACLAALGCSDREPTTPAANGPSLDAQGPLDPALVAAGRMIFRYETYGDESFWTDTLRMHEVIASEVSPKTALAVGLKVDVDALPAAVQAALRAGTVDLNDPATTVALLKLGAVVGVVGQVDASNRLKRVGITCALCHSTVDNSFAPGIGKRLDGWPNRDLDPGAIIALSPALTTAQRLVYQSWGPGRYDPRFNIDGINLPVIIPPAFGMRHVKREIYTGDDTVSYWNAYVAITQMHGHGHFADARIGVDVNNPPELVASKLEALRVYQFSLQTPPPVEGSFDAAAARRGRAVFNGVAKCASCHLGGALTDVNAGRLHTPAEVGQDPAYAARSATKLYRTTPLRGLWHPPQLRGPYFHDGSAATLEDAVEHYVQLQGLVLTPRQKADLVEYLKTL